MRAPLRPGVDFSDSDSDSDSGSNRGRSRANTAMSVESDFDPEEAARLRAAWSEVSAPVAAESAPASPVRPSLKGAVVARSITSPAGGAAPAAAERWTRDQTHCLGTQFEEEFLGKAVFFNSVSSVEEATRRLNSGDLQCDDGVCIVFSKSRDLIFLLWRADRREVALERFRVSEDPRLAATIAEIGPLALNGPEGAGGQLSRDDSLFRLPSSLLSTGIGGPTSPRTPGTKTSKSREQELAERGLASVNTAAPSDSKSDSEASSDNESPLTRFGLAPTAMSWEKISEVLGAVRGVPESWTRVLFLEMLDGMGFAGRYDCVYMPVDATRQCNFGYAFVTMSSLEIARDVAAAFEGKTQFDFPSPQECTLSWQSPDRGLEAPRRAGGTAKPDAAPEGCAKNPGSGECRPLWFVGGESVQEPPTMPHRIQSKAG